MGTLHLVSHGEDRGALLILPNFCERPRVKLPWPTRPKNTKTRFEEDDSYVAKALRSRGKCGDDAKIPFLEEAARMKSPRNLIGLELTIVWTGFVE